MLRVTAARTGGVTVARWLSLKCHRIVMRLQTQGTFYVYPDDPRPEIHDFMARYKARYGIDINYIGQTGVIATQIALARLWPF